MSIELDDLASGNTGTKINENFSRIEEYINDNLLHRDGVESGQANQMELDLDMNGFNLLNVGNVNGDSSSLITVGQADARYVNVSGDTMQGDLFVQEPVEREEAAQYGQVLDEIVARASADASLQGQISGANDIPIAERPIIQWHGKLIENAIVIPDNVNAFSAGPEITIAEGQSVTIGDGSAWTIMDGAGQDGDATSIDEGYL